ncbi:MAG: molybdopterin biosynthesis protein MoeA [Methanoregula sp. PtaU1.Bin051]|nr:MAG: molybdopterin biosynthesis protein MoeA [Methanoregula sp. PtaU1.Bin051]
MVNRYLTLTPLEQALSILKSSFQVPAGLEVVPITKAIGRVIAVPVYAKYSVPEASLAAMDGIAVRSADTIGASDQAPVTLERFVRVNTGNIVPPGFDAVIMIEDTWESGDQFQIRKSAPPNQHIRPACEDIREGQLVLPVGHQVRPFDIGALATYGITHVEVRSVRVGIIPTGSELVPLGVRPAPGQVVESNTIMAQVFLSSMGACCRRYPIIRDDPDLIAQALEEAVRDNDLVIISAGSSAGTRDFTAGVIRSLGELLFHGVAIRPGKPVMLGRISGKPVLGLPGYPLAAQTVLREFAAPLLESWGFAPAQRYTVMTRIFRALASDPGFDDFVPVYVGRVGTTCWGVPQSRGSGVQMATIKANGYTHVPAPLEGYEADSEIEVILTTDPARIDRTLLLSGLLDPSLEDLANLVHEKGLFLHASSFGTTGALLALRKKACHAVPASFPPGSLLPDCHFLMQNIPPEGLIFIHIAAIRTGIASRKGITLDTFDANRWVNAKRDSTARFLFDSFLSSHGLDPGRINGYRNEAGSPAAAAKAVANRIADAGICTAGTASEAGLCFMEIGQEQYGLAVHPDLLPDHKIQSLISVIRSSEFRHLISGYPGYDVASTGTIHKVSNDRTIAEVSGEIPVQGSSSL